MTTLALGGWAGLALSLPVTMLTVLVVDLALRRGPLVGVAAGAAVTLAASVLAWFALLVASIAGPDGLLVDFTAAGMLLAFAVRGLVWMILGPRGIPSSAIIPKRPAETFFRVAAIAILRPAEIVAMVGIALALTGLEVPVADRPAAAIGLVGTVAAWQLVLVAFGLAQRRLGRRLQLGLNLAGYGLAIGLAVVVAQSG